jgi:ribosomal-protein-alanine N-acetyltransferase
MSDLEPYHALVSDVETAHAVKRVPTTSLEQSGERLARTLVRQQTGELMMWAMTAAGTDAMLGFLGLCRFDRDHRRAEVAYELARAHRGNGLMTEAVQRVVEHAFNHVRLHRVEGHVDPSNVRSVGVLERAGFVREGVLRENYRFDGVFYDTAVYARLAGGG